MKPKTVARRFLIVTAVAAGLAAALWQVSSLHQRLLARRTVTRMIQLSSVLRAEAPVRTGRGEVATLLRRYHREECQGDAWDRPFEISRSESAEGRHTVTYTIGRARSQNYRFLGGSVNTALIAEAYQYLGRDGKPSQRDTTLTFAGTTNEHFVQTFGYHELGMLEAQSYPNCTGFSACTSAGRTVSNVFTEGRLTAVSGYTGTAPGQTAGLGITYHPNGQVNQVAHVNSVVATHGLDPNNLPRPASINASRAGTTLWDTGTYRYDGSGNIWKIGTSWFEYDALSRLTTGAVFPNPLGGGTQQKQSSAFDVFGNIQSLTTQIGAGTASSRLTPTSSATNRLASPSTYDTAGALTNWNGAFYEYDGLNQLAHYGSGTEDWSYIYTADDERIWSFKPAQGATPRFDRWTLRGLDGQVLREYPISGYVWNTWEDNIYRDGQLLANYLSGGQRRHFDLDHLGTPRLLTNLGGTVTSYHVYYPFGEEATLSTQDNERLKFTGHERDLNNQTGSNPSADDLDYMHARFCSPVTGRFLATDPGRDWSPQVPQSWVRYSYARGNPQRNLDPDGRVVETLWDVVSIGIGGVSLINNLRKGNYKSALVDAGGLVVDGVAAAIPFVPGGAGAVIKTARIANAVDNSIDATKAVGKVDLNKLNHIFGQAKHNLDDFVAAAGSREAAFGALEKSTQSAVSAQKIDGKFEIGVVVNGFAITVRGVVKNGVARIGTAFK